MKPLTKRVVTPHGPGRAPIINFVTYIDADQPNLRRRIGWEIADDLHDDMIDTESTDNGRTWGNPRVAAKRHAENGGYVFTQEGGAVFLPKRNLLVNAMNQTFQPSLDGHTQDTAIKMRFTCAPPRGHGEATPVVTDFGLRQGIATSFTHPIEDSRGRVLVPAAWQRIEEPGGPLHRLGIPFRADMPDTPVDYYVGGLVIGEFDADGQINWQLGGAVPCADDASSRGLCEPTVAELADGRLAMVMRGSNHLWLDRPGCKWHSLSSDGGASWSPAAPLRCDDGTLIESSATGSALFRSIKTGGLYWIGNLCLDGQRPHGWGSNMPRSPLVIARVREEPFALERGSITVIDRQQPGENPLVQMSNFRMYQDRETGDAVLYLTRYGERGHDGNEWLKADQYEYRVEIA